MLHCHFMFRDYIYILYKKSLNSTNFLKYMHMNLLISYALQTHQSSYLNLSVSFYVMLLIQRILTTLFFFGHRILTPQDNLINKLKKFKMINIVNLHTSDIKKRKLNQINIYIYLEYFFVSIYKKIVASTNSCLL